jgi:hypothetical protein
VPEPRPLIRFREVRLKADTTYVHEPKPCHVEGGSRASRFSCKGFGPWLADDVTIGLAVDIETLEAIDTLRSEVQHVETTLGMRIQEFETRVESRFQDVLRHFNVVAESFRDDVRMIAEGVVALDAKVESIRRRLE